VLKGQAERGACADSGESASAQRAACHYASAPAARNDSAAATRCLPMPSTMFQCQRRGVAVAAPLCRLQRLPARAVLECVAKCMWRKRFRRVERRRTASYRLRTGPPTSSFYYRFRQRRDAAIWRHSRSPRQILSEMLHKRGRLARMMQHRDRAMEVLKASAERGVLTLCPSA